MGHFYFLLTLGVIVLAAFVLSLQRGIKRRLQLPYVLDEALFTAPQRAFKGVLERAVGKQYEIYGKVHAIDVIGLRARLSQREQALALSRVGDRRFDFLICSKETTAILCAVNLAPRSRLRKLAPKDALDRICAAAGLPFVRFRESAHYSVVDIEEQIFAAMQARGTRPEVEDIHLDEATTLLRDLSQASVDEQRTPRAALPRLAPVAPGARVAPARRPSDGARRGSEPRRPKRRAPTLGSHEHHVVDDGPSFKIDGELDDDRPQASRRI
ncbi:DUF2726 domain-containing protein [Thiorhodococcus mannitoliphagus]|uniref:DUF2726 domain-containing protein n=1 Tax=Thiorhodococcus mannitoliphagus TaxID=329406 RepID=A0A6P1E059_9GAMM|nr:DUF2726 domain-containing protein [Thiorhodococcus mannitoliphagus]NEX22671.1 DUF2726 domain-containing protein [Thiorhodococcus mannitoliphagus]